MKIKVFFLQIYKHSIKRRKYYNKSNTISIIINMGNISYIDNNVLCEKNWVQNKYEVLNQKFMSYVSKSFIILTRTQGNCPDNL